MLGKKTKTKKTSHGVHEKNYRKSCNNQFIQGASCKVKRVPFAGTLGKHHICHSFGYHRSLRVRSENPRAEVSQASRTRPKERER